MRSPRWFVVLFCLWLLGSCPVAASSTCLVDRLTDDNPAGGGEGSGLSGDLRYCLTHAGAGDTLGFVVFGEISLSALLPQVSVDLTLNGPGTDLLTVHGAGGTVFSIGPAATVTLSELTITGGSGSGGGIFNRGTLTVTRAHIRDNTAGDPTNGDGTGAGIWNHVSGTLTLESTTVSGNTVVGNLSYAPSRGGGIANDGVLLLVNSTISGNTADQGFGGGIASSQASSFVSMVNSTVSGNSSPGTDGSGGMDNVGAFQVSNSIVAGNTDGDLSGDVTSGGYNLFGTTDGSGFVATDLLGVDPELGPLDDNGGPTPTMEPLAGSSAVDRIPGTPGTNFPNEDQRGVDRPQGSLADSGAVEAGGPPVAQISGIAPTSGSPAGGDEIVVTGSDFLAGASLTVGGVPASGVVVVNSSRIEAVSPGLPAGILHDLAVSNFVSSAPQRASAGLPKAWLADFFDVDQDDVFHDYVESILRDGITAGCGGGNYCRNSPVTRAQMAVFLLKAEHGAAYAPPSCQGVCSDGECPGQFADGIERLAAEGVTGGCGAGTYCPDLPVTRAQMSAFLLKTAHGPGFSPPDCTGVFGDVACPSLFADWIEELYAEDVTGGCGTSPLLYCPASSVTRGQMAVFLVKAFSAP